MNKIIIIFLVTITLSSCFKEDEMINPHDPGEVTTVVIPMTRYYSNQVYFDLKSNNIVSTNVRSIFDLNFNCADTSTVIKLNTADFAMAAETMYINLEDVNDTTGLNWNFDSSDGNLDSLAIFNWISITNGDTSYSNRIWVINRGVNSQGISLGIKKIQFHKIIGNRYLFSYSNLDNSDKVDAIIKKDNLFAYTQYSFIDADTMQIEPKSANWDLLFTEYTTLLFTSDGLPYPYLLTGVLQNQGFTHVALDTTMVFDNIVISDTVNFEFSSSLDKIGYEWKKLVGDVNTGNVYYEIRLNYNYIIEDGNSYFYKLRFINFYDPLTGEKGYPTFEYQRL